MIPTKLVFLGPNNDPLVTELRQLIPELTQFRGNWLLQVVVVTTLEEAKVMAQMHNRKPLIFVTEQDPRGLFGLLAPIIYFGPTDQGRQVVWTAADRERYPSLHFYEPGREGVSHALAQHFLIIPCPCQLCTPAADLPIAEGRIVCGP
jgi:hypothetical protein